MVVELVEDLDLEAVGDAHMGDVGLPALVGLFSGEADDRAAGALVGLVHDESTGSEHPPDRRQRRHHGVAGAQVVLDSRRARIEALFGEGLAQLDDVGVELGRGPVGT